MGSHSYLVNLNTNIGDLHTSGLLNSHASAYTTTNVGHMVGDRTSVISLGELQELSLNDDIDRMNKARGGGLVKRSLGSFEFRSDPEAHKGNFW